MVGKVNNWCKNNINILKILMQTFICVAMFLTIELSPIFDYYYVFPLFWIILIVLITKTKNKIENKKKEKIVDK